MSNAHRITTAAAVLLSLAAAGAPAVTQTPQSGFNWGDAGIGAAGGLALSLIALGGGLASSSQRRGRRARHSAA